MVGARAHYYEQLPYSTTDACTRDGREMRTHARNARLRTEADVLPTYRWASVIVKL